MQQRHEQMQQQQQGMQQLQQQMQQMQQQQMQLQQQMQQQFMQMMQQMQQQPPQPQPPQPQPPQPQPQPQPPALAEWRQAFLSICHRQIDKVLFSVTTGRQTGGARGLLMKPTSGQASCPPEEFPWIFGATSPIEASSAVQFGRCMGRNGVFIQKVSVVSLFCCQP